MLTASHPWRWSASTPASAWVHPLCLLVASPRVVAAGFLSMRSTPSERALFKLRPERRAERHSGMQRGYTEREECMPAVDLASALRAKAASSLACLGLLSADQQYTNAHSITDPAMPPRKPSASKAASSSGSSSKKRSGGAGSASRMDISSDEEQDESSASEEEEDADDDEPASESASSGSDGSASPGSDDAEDENEEDGSSDEDDDAPKSRGSGKQPRKRPAAAASGKKGAAAAASASSSTKKGRKRTRDDGDEDSDSGDATSASASATPARAILSISSFDNPASSPPPGLASLLPQLPLTHPPQKSRGSTRVIRKPAAIDENVPSDGESKPAKRRSTAAAASSAAAADSSSSTAAAASAASASSAAAAPIDPDELSDEWRCNANASLFFRLVRPAPEKDSRDSSGAPPTETLQFHPHYTHQLWDDEEIVGYKRVKCVVAFTSGALYTYLHTEYESRVTNAPGIADLTDLIGAKLKGGYTTSWADFQSHIHDEFHPPGEMMAEYTLPSVEETSKKEVISYEVYRGTFNDATLRAYHARLQFFLLFFIDRSSFINDSDLVWEVILLFQKRVCLTKGVTTYHIVGYTTLYKFLSYPEDWKMRLSQILILPPYQRVGHGQKLLAIVYAEAEKRRMIEVNIEDPSPVFQMLRDLTDIQLAKKQRFFEKNGQRHSGQQRAARVAPTATLSRAHDRSCVPRLWHSLGSVLTRLSAACCCPLTVFLFLR